MRQLICAITFSFLIVGNLSCSALKPGINDLGWLPGDNYGAANAINSKGQVVGTCMRFDPEREPVEPQEHVFMWENGRMTKLDVPATIGTPIHVDINDAGQVLVSSVKTAFVYQNGKFTEIKKLAGCTDLEAYDMNNRGQVVGICRDDIADNLPFIWKDGATTPLKKPTKYPLLDSMLIGDNGLIVGRLDDGDWGPCAVLWQNGKVQIIKDIAGFDAVTAVSDQGAVVGVCPRANKARGFILRDGVVKYLDPPKGFNVPTPLSINADGVIAGVCSRSSEEPVAVVWDAKRVPKLLESPGYLGSTADDINDAGVIVGTAIDKKGNPHPVMWMPVK